MNKWTNFNVWCWAFNFYEQGSWTKGILTEQRKLYRLILFLLATKRAWSAPGPKIEFVYERIMRRLWVFHEWLHLAAGSRDRGICLRNPSKNTPQKPYFSLGFWTIFYAFPFPPPRCAWATDPERWLISSRSVFMRTSWEDYEWIMRKLLNSIMRTL